MNSNHRYKIEEISKEIFQYLASQKNQAVKILELGGGTGIHAGLLLQKYSQKIKKFMFTDLSPEMLEKAKKRLEPYQNIVEYCVCGAENFDFDDKFDAIYISGAMHHFENPKRSILKVKDALNPGGVFVLCEPIITNPYAFIRIIWKREEWGQFIVTKKNCEKMISEAGFSIRKSRVLHYRSNHPAFRKLLSMEKHKCFDWLGVMFLIVAVKQD